MSDDNITPGSSTESIGHNITKQSDDPLTYRVATLLDCEALSLLINSCYRGEASCQGWTTEHFLLGGQRIDVDMLADIINDSTGVFLVFFDPIEKFLVGGVYLQHKSAAKSAYLGMLTVRPDLQTRGYGKFIMLVAENYAVDNWNVEFMEMTVIIHRSELIAYYNRRGYINTGRREPFPMHDIKYGIPKRQDLEFYVLQKSLKKT
jgi:GNAT superfamily N-acetyltransferase